MKKNREKMSKVDFISKNMEIVTLDPEDMQREKLFKIRTKWNMIETAKSRKELIEIEQ